MSLFETLLTESFRSSRHCPSDAERSERVVVDVGHESYAGHSDNQGGSPCFGRLGAAICGRHYWDSDGYLTSSTLRQRLGTASKARA